MIETTHISYGIRVGDNVHWKSPGNKYSAPVTAVNYEAGLAYVEWNSSDCKWENIEDLYVIMGK
jgi:hypothetical protein